MKENGMTSGCKNWTSEDKRSIKIALLIIVVGYCVSNILPSEIFKNLYAMIYSIIFKIFVIAPLFIYYRNFNMNSYKYIYITPVKKSYVLFTSLKVWFIGFILFLALILFLGIIKVNPVLLFKYTNWTHFLITFFHLAMIIIGVYMVFIGLDIIAVVKGIPRIITVILGGLIIAARGLSPEIFIYNVETNVTFFDYIQLAAYFQNDYSPMATTYYSMNIPYDIITLIIGGILFIYALSIFENYNGDKYKGFSKFKI